MDRITVDSTVPASGRPDRVIEPGVARGSETEADVSAPIASRRDRGIQRWRIWFAAAMLAGVLVLVSQPLMVAPLCLSMAVMAASALASRSSGPGPDKPAFGIVGWLPAAFVLLNAWGLCWGLVAGIGSEAWSTRANAVLGFLLFAFATGLGAFARAGTVPIVRKERGAAVGFAALMTFFVVLVVTQPLALWSRVNGAGTDFLRHLGFIRDLRATGSLVPGQAGYPPVLHSLAAWLTALEGVSIRANELWLAVAPVGFLMLGLMLLGIMLIATRLTEHFLGGVVLGHVAGFLAAFVFLQTAWFSAFPAFGSLMNILVAVVLIALLATGLERGVVGSRIGTLVCGAALAVTANAWQLLLPVVGAASLPWIVQSLRKGVQSKGDWAIWALAGALTVNGVLRLGPVRGAAQGTATPTVSDLFRPDWWWWVALALALGVLVVAWVHGLRAWALMGLASIASAVALVAVLVRMTGSKWDLLLYYPAKTLWTSMIVVIPLASAGVVCLTVWGWRRARSQSEVASAFLRGSGVLITGLVLVGVMGRGFAFPPHLVAIAEGRAGMPNWSLALIDSMGDRRITESEQGALVFGLVPSASTGGVVGGLVGAVDFMGMEALAFVGDPGAAGAPVKDGLYRRDMVDVCTYLGDHPDALGITGPNPAAGPTWIVDSGCSVDAVRPGRWISLDLDPVWLERSDWEAGAWTFPSFAEVQAARSNG
jgi:hypothetical protein